jgi:hypothetical protein
MARIRSVHPGINTDEAFMAASLTARLFVISLWMEAWDDGVFEWKPLVLKARIFPADAVDVVSVLTELEGLNFVKRFEIGGKSYGLVRNFCKFQRPKKPNSSGFMRREFMNYVGLKEAEYGTSTEQVPNQGENGSEKPKQMEDGGGERGNQREEYSRKVLPLRSGERG